MRFSRWNTAGVALFGIGTGWLLAAATVTSAPARAEVTSVAPDANLVAITKDSGAGTQILYLIDPQQKVLSVYEFDARKTKLKLAAVRHYSADQLLSEFNNDSPHVAEIDKLVRQR